MIEGIEAAEKDPACVVFHAGTALSTDGKLQTAGGRVLNVTYLAEDLSKAIEGCYTQVEKIQFDGSQFRTDIGRR